ncbi:unnamed protein product [Adineta ricciae]|uniref:Reverse transcriptase domain-containing protein n=1 Tax=Adineta ricciae TaxID=249248 RepID=A0A816EZY5_ADIRI|nr:unnamed protein product [Adineta ricciae]
MNPSAKIFNPHPNLNYSFSIPVNCLTKAEENILKAVIQEWTNVFSLDSLLNNWSEYRNKSALLMNPKKNISLLLLNVASLKRYLVEVFNLIQSTLSPIIILNGIYHDPDTIKRFSSHFFNYNIFTSKGTNKFGGVLIAVHKSIQCRRPEEFTRIDNLIVLEISSGADLFQLVTCYSPPEEKIPLTIFDRILHINPNTIFTGDLNAKHKSWSKSVENPKGYSLFNWLSSPGTHSSLEIINRYLITSTRSDATIDLIIAPSKLASTSFSGLQSIGSDHYPVVWELPLKIISSHHKISIKRTNWKAFELFITSVGNYWQQLAELMNHSATFFSLYERFLSLCLARFTTITQRHAYKPSLPHHIVQMIQQKRIYLQAFRRTRHPYFSLLLHNMTKQVHQVLFQHKRQLWLNYCNTLNDCDTKSFWKKIKRHFKSGAVPIDGFVCNNNIITDPIEMCSMAKDHYEVQFANHPPDHSEIEKEAEYINAEIENDLIRNPPPPIIINFLDLKRAISSLKNKNSTGVDGVSNRIIKNLPSNHLSFISQCFNNFASLSQTPPQWHIAKMILLSKSKARTISVDETRPISLLPCFSKLFEKCFLLHFRQWIKDQGLLPDEQSGFRPGHNMAVRLVAIVDQIGQSLSKHTAAGGLFVDFRTAFNQLWFNGLWLKLTKLNCPMKLVTWLRHYLCNRKAFIDIKSSQSTAFILEKGVPQGSVMGPVLFIVYHHDLIESLSTIHWKHLFADDLAILFAPDSSLAPSKMIKDIIEQMMKVLNRLIDYSKYWKQPINFKKTYWMLFNRQVAPKVPEIICQGHHIDKVNRFKYLGTILDEKLSFNSHIDYIKSKINSNLKIFKRLTSTRMTNEKTNLKLFNAYIRPYYQSLLNIYPILSTGKKNELESLNRKIFRIVYTWHDARNVEITNMTKYRSIAELTATHWAKLTNTIIRTNPSVIQDYLQHKMSILYIHEYLNNPTLAKERRTIFERGRIRKYIVNLIKNNRMSLFDHTLSYPC